MIDRTLGAILLSVAFAAVLAGCYGEEDAGAGSANAISAEPPVGAAGPVADCAELRGVIDRIVCFADLASEARDRSLCDAATAEGVRFQCYAVFAERVGNAEACRAILPRTEEHVALRDACLADVAPVIERDELCEEIVTVGLRDSCHLNVFRKTGDSGLCDLIADPGLKGLCTGEPVIVTP